MTPIYWQTLYKLLIALSRIFARARRAEHTRLKR